MQSKDGSSPIPDSQTPECFLSGPGSCRPAVSETAVLLSPASASDRNPAVISPAAAPSLSVTAALYFSTAARILARFLPAGTVHSSASPVLPAAPYLHSTPAPWAG